MTTTNESALSIVTRFCRTRGLPQPTALVGATDPGTLQMQALLEEEVNELVIRYEWQQTCQYFTFTTVAAQLQACVDGNVPFSTLAGYQIVNVGGAKIGASATGLANDSTNYTATVVIDGVTKNVAVTGSTAQTYTTLLSQINTDLGSAGTTTLFEGNLKITSATTGASSTVAITDGVTNLLFGTLTNYHSILSAVAGSDPLIPAGAGFFKIINDTLWDSTRRLPLFGPRRMQDIAMLLAIPVTGPFLQYQIWNNQLNIIPAPAAGDTVIGFYQTRNGWVDTTGITTGQYIAADTDQCLLDSQLVFLGLKWRWLQAKGLAFGAAQQEYEARVAQAMVSNRPHTKKSLTGTTAGYFDPVVVMPAGSWPAQT
jgi:hypothetical protein